MHGGGSRAATRSPRPTWRAVSLALWRGPKIIARGDGDTELSVAQKLDPSPLLSKDLDGNAQFDKLCLQQADGQPVVGKHANSNIWLVRRALVKRQATAHVTRTVRAQTIVVQQVKGLCVGAVIGIPDIKRGGCGRGNIDVVTAKVPIFDQLPVVTLGQVVKGTLSQSFFDGICVNHRARELDSVGN